MAYEYTDPKRASESHALPDVEVFHLAEANVSYYLDDNVIEDHPSYWNGSGFYYAYGSPGCLWDSDPIGPFEGYEEALADARENAGVY